MMEFIRSKAGKFIIFPTVVFFLLFMVWGIVAETGQTAPTELGRVNGEPITILAYQNAIEQLTQQAQEAGGGKITPEQQREIRERAWNQLVNDAIMRQEMERRGIGVSNDEIVFAAKNLPHPQLAQQEIFQTNGQFDISKYQAFVAGPQATDEWLATLEGYYRNLLPRIKLERQLAAGSRVTDAELWRAFQDQNERATVEYVALDLARLAPGQVNVTDAEVRAYYESRPEAFERPRTARLTVAYIPKTVTDADRQAALQRAQQIRQELAGGADFAEVARRESQDPGSAAQGGDLGTFGRGQMVGAFDSAAFSLPVNEISQPVQTQFGLHLIQVQERTGDQVKARHILLPVGKSEAELAKLDARADSLSDRAERSGMDVAARAVGAAIRRGVSINESLPAIPGVGPAQEALDWAATAEQTAEGGKRPISDVFENENALYLVELESYAPKGRMTLAEATPQIRRDLVVQKKREQARAAGQKMVAEVRAGRTLQQVAAARGLTVANVGPFARVEPNPALGQANAAIGAAFGVPIGQVSNVVETQTGLFIIRPLQRTPADRKAWEAQKTQQRAGATYQMQQSTLQRWMESARRKAEIVDNREKLLGAA
jgi:peptidyl-prolyl cis-trans isomerase D